MKVQAIRARCEKDFETFCYLFFPHYAKYPFNQFHRDCFEFYRDHTRGIRVIDGAPRGYAKSTVKGLFKPLHDLAYGLENYILYVSCTESQAVAKLKDIRAEIVTNDGLFATYGMQFSRKNPGESSFTIISSDQEIFLQAVGSGTEIRGLRFHENRPSKIILDDVEDSEEVFNEEIRDKVKSWYFEVISNLGSNETNIEVIGTVLHKKSLLKSLVENPAYKSKLYKAVVSWADRQDLWEQWRKIYTNLDDPERVLKSDQFYKDNEVEMLKGTKVLWPEKESYLFLMKEMIEKGKKAFFKEKQNEPIGDEDTLFDRIHWYHETDKGLLIESSGAIVTWDELTAYGVIDPATGESKKKTKTKLDFTCLLSGYQDFKGRLFVHKDWTKREKPTRYISEIFEHHEVMGYEKFAVETNLYRNLLMENIVRERKNREAERKTAGVKNWGLRIPFYEIENRDKKEKRIFTLEPKVTHGWILFNRSLSMEFMDQVEHFPNGDHDDGPDALEMLWGLVNNRYKPSPVELNAIGAR